MKLKIMTIESINEPATKQLLKTIYEAPQFSKYEIKHSFFLEKDQKSIGSNELYELFLKNIKSFQPDVILIHTGVYFFYNIQSFIEALLKIRKMHPNILLGIQNRSNLDDDLRELFDRSDEIRKIENEFFKVQR